MDSQQYKLQPDYSILSSARSRKSLIANESRPASTEEIAGKLDQIIQMLNILEKLIQEKPEYAELKVPLELTKLSVGLYDSSLRTTARIRTQEELSQKPVSQDLAPRCLVKAKLIVDQKEIHSGANVPLAIHFVNSGNVPVLLVKIEGIVPKGFELLERPEHCMLEGDGLTFVERRLDPSEITEMKLVLKSKKKGEFTLAPRILYADETEEQKSCELEPVNLSVKELGLRGWLKGE